MGQKIPAGSFAVGRVSAARELNMSESKYYRIVKKLESLGCITQKSNNRFTHIFIEKWGVYQGDLNNERTTDEQQMNNERTTDEQPANTIEERKERKK